MVNLGPCSSHVIPMSPLSATLILATEDANSISANILAHSFALTSDTKSSLCLTCAHGISEIVCVLVIFRDDPLQRCSVTLFVVAESAAASCNTSHSNTCLNSVGGEKFVLATWRGCVNVWWLHLNWIDSGAIRMLNDVCGGIARRKVCSADTSCIQ